VLGTDEFVGVLGVGEVVERDDRAALVVSAQVVSIPSPQRQKTFECQSLNRIGTSGRLWG